MRTLAALGVFVMLELVPHASQAIGLPLVISATVDYTPAGANGSSGSALVCATAPNVYLLTAANGTQTCQPRYVDNGDFTVTDNQTGLMWEKKFDGSIAIICSL